MNQHQKNIIEKVGSHFSPPQFILTNTTDALLENIPAYDLYFAKTPDGIVRSTANKVCTVEYLQYMLRSWSMSNMRSLNWALWTDDEDNAEKDIILSIMDSSGESMMTRSQPVIRLEHNGGIVITPDPEPFTMFHDVIIPGISPGKSWYVYYKSWYEYYQSMPIGNRVKRV